MGSQEYMNAFNRYQIERNAQLNPLQSLAGVGQTTANQLGQYGAANAANVGNLMTGGAAAQAAGRVGAANAATGGLGTYLNYTSSNNLLNALRGTGSSSPTNAQLADMYYLNG
jgi:Flp pilus assembly secretin CpaC